MLIVVTVGLVVVGAARRRARARPWKALRPNSSSPHGSGWPRVPARWRARLARALTDAGICLSPEEAVMLGGIGALLVIIVAGTLSPALAVLAAPTALASGPAVLWVRRHHRGWALCAAVPGLLDEVARELRAGGTIIGALDRVAATGDHVDALTAFRDARVAGISVVDALERWVRSHDDQAAAVRTTVAAAAGALATAAAAGGQSAYALEGVAEALRAEVDARAEARAQGAQGRASAAVLAGLAPASLVLGAALAPASARVLLVDPIGNVALAGGLGCEVLGVWWMRRILSVS